jgi:hypothetical protein
VLLRVAEGAVLAARLAARLKPRAFKPSPTAAKQVAEKVVINVRSFPQALKRAHILNDLTARVELVPFPRPFELDFLRSL